MPKYDPNKQYKWEEETDFTLSGSEFGLIMNTFRSVLRSPEAQRILMINTANEAVEEVMKRSVETGLVKEAPMPDAQAPPPQTSEALPAMKKVEDDAKKTSTKKK